MKAKGFIKCPICRHIMTLGKVDDKYVACCVNKDCESTLVLGDPIQETIDDFPVMPNVSEGEGKTK